MIDALSQAWVSIFGLPALACSLTTMPRLRRLGVILGLIGQPGWYVQIVTHEQWLMGPVYIGYTLAWLWGLWNLWIRPAMGRTVAP